jgi:hypothetical protein
MSYYSVDYSASGRPHLSAAKDCFGNYEETKEVPTDVCDLVHSPLKHLSFFLWLHTCRLAFWHARMPGNVSD